MQPDIRINKIRIFSAMGLWLVLLGTLLLWMKNDSRADEYRLALKAANAFFQQITDTRTWNVYHSGFYIPIGEDALPNNILIEPSRVITADAGMKLSKISPPYTDKRSSNLQENSPNRAYFHIVSLNPINPENTPTEWEQLWLNSFEQGVKEQSEFFVDGPISWFRYMAPLLANRSCLTCHNQGDYREQEPLGGISVSIPYPTHTHTLLFAGFGAVAFVGVGVIFFGGSLYERKKILFDATFNSTIPTSVTDTNHTILLANESYWKEFGRPEKSNTLKCYEHRSGDACHTEHCPLVQIKGGASHYECESSKKLDGVIHHYLVQARPLVDGDNEVIGVVESFQDITIRKTLELEKEKLINELQTSFDTVKVLKGLIPICAACKQIRDDKGYWSQVEAYISRHSEAKFSHGICPDCVRKLYPAFSDEILRNVSSIL